MDRERIDTRKLEPAAREQLRRTVLRLHRRGHSQAVIAAELGLRRPTVSAWLAKARVRVQGKASAGVAWVRGP